MFLKDVPHSALKDLIQFMYCGEVNVKQDALPTFISTAEALQIKGLTENADPQVSTPSTSSTHIPIKTTNIATANIQRARPIQQRNISRTPSYKIDSEDSSDDKAVHVQQAQKRVNRQSTPAQQSKRIKTIQDPLDDVITTKQQSSGSQQTIQITTASDKSVGEPEFIDLPIETIPTKAEPDYGDDGEVEESGENEATYVEDESYGE